jgi:EF-P beta-lysylation protein EpmB
VKTPAHPWPPGAWRTQLAESVTDLDELLEALDLDASLVGDRAAVEQSVRSFGLRVPRGYLGRMRRGDANDPLLAQVLPVEHEADLVEGFSSDPLGELRQPLAGGVLHKYRGRALIVVSGACAVHCRYCFRRHFDSKGHHAAADRFDAAVRAIDSDSSITEVILSGGDPLMLPDMTLEVLARRLADLPAVERLRFHTRMPIVLPQRVDGTLCLWLGSLGMPVVVVVHANHAREIDSDVRRAMAALRGAGVVLLNQSVLLRGVNDSADALVDLSEALFAAGVLPYYLHMLDPVQGAAHFEVPEVEGRDLMEDVRARLPGYLVPRLVREIPGAPAKVGIDLWS